MKHERDIRPAGRSQWRLKKTLARKLSFRPIEEEDIRYAWAGYKAGSLDGMAGPFVEPGLQAGEFKEVFQQTVIDRYSGAWTMFAETKKGYLPVGILFAFYSHKDPKLSPFMIIGDLVWFPWASARNKIESAVNFFATIRKTVPMVDYAYGETNQRFFDTICKHAVMRRAGTTFNVVQGKPCAIYETRAD